MNTSTLEKILQDHLESQSVNRYFHNFSSTRKIAEYYTGTLPHVTSKIEGKKIDFYYKDTHIGFIDGQKVSTNSREARKICNDKFESEKYLRKMGVATTNSRIFNKNEFREAAQFVKASPGPKVVKPTMLNGAKGITMNVHDSNFEFAWNNAIDACLSFEREPAVLVQDQLEGIEVRVLVIEGIYNSAILRAPAHVVGDGHHSIQELIDNKNELKLKNPHQRTRLIKIDENVQLNLKERGLELTDIPENEDYVFLQYTSNISIGGDPYEVSDLLGKEIKNLAEEAVRAIPGLSTGGVDVMVSSLTDENPSVLEVNAAANLRLHHYPFKGPFRTPIYNLIHTLSTPYI